MTIGTHRTVVTVIGDATHCIYHNTSVAKLCHKYGSIELNSGGYRTRTTAKRMNQCLSEWGFRARVVQRDFEWFIDYGDGERLPYFDGMRVHRGAGVEVAA